MPQRIEVPGQGILEFPDNMNDGQIAEAIERNFGKALAPYRGGGTPEERMKAMNPDYAPDTVPEWGRENPNLYGVAGATLETLRPVAEIAGLVGGGLVGGAASMNPVTAPLTGLAGAGMGYAGAKGLLKGADVALGNVAPESIQEALTSTGKNVAEGVAIEAGGQIGSKLIASGAAKVAEKAQPLAKKLYESALKPVPSLKTSVREKVLATGLENARVGGPYKPTEGHVYQVSQNISKLVQQSDDIVRQAAKEGDAIPTAKLASAVDDLAKEYAKGPFPVGDLQKLQAYKDELIATHGEKIPVDAALDMKKRIYESAKKYYESAKSAGATHGLDPIRVDTEKAIARALRTELEELYPATGAINKEASKQIDFAKVLERAANRTGNRELFSLFDFLGSAAGGTVGGGPGAATGMLMSKIMTGPQAKSILAKTISKAAVPSPVKLEILNQIARYGALGAQRRDMPKRATELFSEKMLSNTGVER